MVSISYCTSTGRFAVDREFVYIFDFCLEKRASLLVDGQVDGRVRVRWVRAGCASVRVCVATWHLGSRMTRDSPRLDEFQVLLYVCSEMAICLAKSHWSAART